MLALSRLTIDSIDLAQASVRGTFSSSTAVARERLQRPDGDSMCLIPPEIIARPHIDDTDGDVGRLAIRAPDPVVAIPAAVPSENRGATMMLHQVALPWQLNGA
jgi:hypothetical protein